MGESESVVFVVEIDERGGNRKQQQTNFVILPGFFGQRSFALVVCARCATRIDAGMSTRHIQN